MTQAILQACKNGAQVKVLMAGEGFSDVAVVHWACQHIYELMIKHGVQVFELQEKVTFLAAIVPTNWSVVLFLQVLHAKTITVDGVFTSIGSFNFDHFSSSQNLELAVTVLDPGIASQMEHRFELDLKMARKITLDMLEKRSWTSKLVHRLAYAFVRFTSRIDI